MVILDGVVRLLPGALGDPDSVIEESFEDGLLEYPQYTRPPVFRGMEVPEVLLSGDHGKIAAWRKEQALIRTRERRADLLESQYSQLDGLVEDVQTKGGHLEESRRKAVSARTEPGGADALSGRSESERLEKVWLRGRRGHDT